MSEKDSMELSRLPTRVFGYEFTHIPEFIRDDIASLEREGVLYADHWIDEINDFRHVRIQLTQDEGTEYARRCWAYELFLRAGSPKWARNVPGIDHEIADEADTYELVTVDGKTFGPPYHCFGAFLGPHLESLSCGAVPERQSIIELQGRESSLFTIERAIESLTAAIRAFNGREKGLNPWPIEREDDVRDLLYVMLRSSLFDIKPEEPTPSFARTHKFADLCSHSSKVLIEVKWIGRKGYWKTVLDQIYTDIQTYSTHPASETIVFVIVDAARDIPDPRLIEKQLSGEQIIRKKSIDIRVFVVDP